MEKTDSTFDWKAFFSSGKLYNASQKSVDVSTLNGKMVGFYFTASWCAPCRQFSPLLINFRNRNAAEFEVVMVSQDRTSDEAFKYMKQYNMPWLMNEHNALLGPGAKEFNVTLIPTLVIVSPTGRIITNWGRSAVWKCGKTCLAEWKKGNSGVSLWRFLWAEDSGDDQKQSKTEKTASDAVSTSNPQSACCSTDGSCKPQPSLQAKLTSDWGIYKAPTDECGDCGSGGQCRRCTH